MFTEVAVKWFHYTLRGREEFRKMTDKCEHPAPCREKAGKHRSQVGQDQRMPG